MLTVSIGLYAKMVKNVVCRFYIDFIDVSGDFLIKEKVIFYRRKRLQILLVSLFLRKEYFLF
mgnify:CR=1 FL=1